MVATTVVSRVNSKLLTRNSRLTLPPRSVINSVMASPPTVTTGSATAMTTPFFRPFNSGNGSFPATGGNPTDFVSYVRGAGSQGVTTTSGGGRGALSAGWSFIHEGSAFELVFAATSTHFLVKVNDQYVTLTSTSTGASGSTYAKCDFGTSARRRIDVFGYSLSLTGINIGQTDTLTPAPVRGPFTIILGDSFTATPVNSAGLSLVPAFADAMGWDNVWASGVGGTGYLNTNGGAAVTFRSRVQKDVLQYNPEIVIVAGSVNDDGQSPSAMATEAALLYAQIVASGATLVVCPTASGGANTWSANKLAIKAALKAACLAAGGLWADPLELPLAVGYRSPTDSTASILTGVLNGSYASGVLGSAGISVTGGSLNGDFPQPGSTIEIGSGANLERLHVKSFSFGGTSGSQWLASVLFDGALQYAHTAGESWRQVGGGYITGKGKVGATTGFGNADLYVSNDGVHPSPAGYLALGQTVADLLMTALAPN